MMTYDRLIQFGTKILPNGVPSYDYDKLEPQLAESWEIAPDNSAVVFKLKQDLKFHDGAPITARDVKWSFDRFVSVGGFPQRQMEQVSLTDVNQFEVVDERTFKIKLQKRDKLTLPSLAIVGPAFTTASFANRTRQTPILGRWNSPRSIQRAQAPTRSNPSSPTSRSF
jgi:peptide/nickel transport system substrate-binding protein